MKKADKQGLIMMGSVFCVFILLTALAVYASIKAEKYDHSTLCPTEDSYAIVRLFIDKTDPWNTQQSKELAKLIRTTKDNLGIFERLIIHVLDESGNIPSTPVFDMCNPGRGDQVSPLYNNKRRVHQKFEEQFATPLENLMEDLLQPGTAPQSPILETFVNFFPSDNQARLIIVSDMMQNTNELSFYGNNWKIIGNKEKLLACKIEKKYTKASIYYINRNNISAAVKKGTTQFWNQCLGDIADEIEWEYL